MLHEFALRRGASARPAPAAVRTASLGQDMHLEERTLLSGVAVTDRLWTITESTDRAGTSWANSTITFTSQTPYQGGDRVSGYFDWVASNGSSGRELFSGTLSSTGQLAVNGYALEDPYRIVLAVYRAQLSADGNSFVGGTWTGSSVIPGVWTATAPPLRPDLTGFRMYYRVPSDDTREWDGPIPVGTPVQVTSHVWNRGAGAAGAFTVRLYASTDPVIDPHTDFPVGDLGTFNGLAASQHRPLTGTVTLPLSLPTTSFGQIYLGVVIDADGQVQESNEQNNSGQRIAGDLVTAQLFDPISPRGPWRGPDGRPLTFGTRRAAIRFLEAQGFTATPSRFLDAGWSRPVAAETVSRYNGQAMAADAFRIQVGVAETHRGSGVWRLIVQGADGEFNPANLSPGFGEPSPRTALSYGLGWTWYVRQYHRRF